MISFVKSNESKEGEVKLNDEESPEERRERLKLLAKERMSRLVNREAILPHSASKHDVASFAEAPSLAANLLDTGSISLQIDSHTFDIEELKELRSERQRAFLLRVEGISLEGVLHWIGGLVHGRFFLSPSGELAVKIGTHSSYGAGTPSESNLCALLYYALFHARERGWFSGYLASAHKKLEEERLALEEARLAKEKILRELGERIQSEAEQFREVLLRKYRQLVYTDEYETVEDSRFIAELKRFAAKRLPDLDTDLVTSSVHLLVLSWLDDDLNSGAQRAFNSLMSPRDYERYCSDLLSVAGWSTQLTPTSGDQGADIICEGGGIRMVVQCKLYSSPVGNGAVQEVIAAKQFEFADEAVVVSNAEFTRSAKELANVSGVLLLNHEQLGTLLPTKFSVKHK